MDAQIADIATQREALTVNAFDYNAFCKLIQYLKTAKGECPNQGLAMHAAP